jgi:hypothetical protein
MSAKAIPTKINKYNVYNSGNRLLGMGDEVTLPTFESSGDTVSGAGVLGEFDDPTVGYFSNMEMEIPFRVLDEEAVDMLDQTKAVQLELRGAQQTTDSEGDIEFRQMRVVVRGRMANFDPGKVKAANGMDTAVTLTVLYILIELEGEAMVELDKINEVYKIRGVDVLATIKEMC